MDRVNCLDDLVGKRVILTDWHPWKGATGLGVQVESTPVGQGLKVALDGRGSVFIFDLVECEVIEEGGHENETV